MTLTSNGVSGPSSPSIDTRIRGLVLTRIAVPWKPEPRPLPLHRSGEAHVVLRQPGLFGSQLAGILGAAGAEQGGFLVQHHD